jgi:hypothetical protein
MKKYFTLLACKKTQTTLLVFLLSLSSFAQNIGINSTGATPDNSAMLDIVASNKGLLIPRVSLISNTDVTTIPSPLTSLMVYNTNASMTNGGVGYWYWNGSVWVMLITGTNNDWHLTGNAGTVDGTNFIGTTDNVPFNIKVNNQWSGRIDSTKSSTFLGFRSGNYGTNTGLNQTSIGYKALFSNTTGQYNTANGANALYSNTTGYHNVANGAYALYGNTTSFFNVADGAYALYSNTTGYDNTACGAYSMYYNTTGLDNTAIGMNSLYHNNGSENVAIGKYAGFGNFSVNLNQCTFVGVNSYPTATRTNVTMLGYGILNAQCTGDNQVILGNTAVTQTGFSGALAPYYGGAYNPGTSGQVLQSNGPGTAPTWTTAANAAGVMLSENLGAQVENVTSTGTSVWAPIIGSWQVSPLWNNNSTSVCGTQNLMSRAGTIKNLYVKSSAASGAGTNIIITVYKNGVATTLTTTLANATSGTDLTHTVTVAAGDEIGIVISSTATPTTHARVSWAVDFN